MQISQISYASMKEDELERLAEVHEDVREFLREKKKKEKRRLYFLLTVLGVTGIVFYFEFSNRTGIFRSFIQELWVVPEQKPHDGNAVPMPFGGKTPLFVPDLNSVAVTDPSPLVQQASYSDSAIQEKKSGALDSSSDT